MSVLWAAGICFVAQVRCSETEVQEYICWASELTIAGVLGALEWQGVWSV